MAGARMAPPARTAERSSCLGQRCTSCASTSGGKRGGFLAGLGFMLPGFLLMPALSVLYVEADLAHHLDELLR